MKRSLPILVLIFAVTMTSSVGLAKNDRAKGKANKNNTQTEAVVRDIANLINPDVTSREMRKYLVGYNVPTAKALPPGIAKNLARGKPLPPGIAKKSFPQSEYNNLPHYDGYEWVQAGASMILVDVASRVIAKVLEKVFD